MNATHFMVLYISSVSLSVRVFFRVPRESRRPPIFLPDSGVDCGLRPGPETAPDPPSIGPSLPLSDRLLWGLDLRAFSPNRLRPLDPEEAEPLTAPASLLKTGEEEEAARLSRRSRAAGRNQQREHGPAPPYQSHDEEEVASLRLAVAGRRAAAAGPLLGEHLPPDDQLTDPPLGRQRQQAVVLAVQTHVQQVLFGQMVGNQKHTLISGGSVSHRTAGSPSRKRVPETSGVGAEEPSLRRDGWMSCWKKRQKKWSNLGAWSL
ncbi:hypothetical protein EYF80_043104 [Liparis tanakae]|uniref:Uncharacterized protein n=1 Tax=Liparis tanakae TaxID=230148 RepID=A0A4Z2FZF0_9TELE|nr:hypothetical protein EYF80_043104 [Liparis tanakae]